MIVVDASVVLHAIADDAMSGEVARARLVGETQLAPHLLDVEVVHGLRRHVRRGLIGTERAAVAVDDLADLSVTRVSHRGLLRLAWEHRDDVSAYDAMYVALAELLGATLVTTDDRLAGAPGIGCEVEVLATP